MRFPFTQVSKIVIVEWLSVTLVHTKWCTNNVDFAVTIIHSNKLYFHRL